MRKTFFYMLMITLSTILIGCGGGSDSETDTQNTPDAFASLMNIPVNQSVLVNVPTYDGSNQVVHPDVRFFNGKFYMTITPYPFSKSSYENPSFYVSNDGLHWETPAGGKNPLVYHPSSGYNDDPDLVIVPEISQFRIYYNETPSSKDVQYLHLLYSNDGITWNDQRIITYLVNQGDPFIVSPAVIEANGKYYLFHVDIDDHNVHWCGPEDPYAHYIRLNISDDGVHWDKSAEIGISIDYPSGFHPWHINVFSANGKYYMLIDGYYNKFCENHNLYLAVSEGDLTNWHFINQPLIQADPGFYNAQIIYRSSGVVTGNDLFVYASFKTYDKRWYLAVKHFKLNEWTN